MRPNRPFITLFMFFWVVAGAEAQPRWASGTVYSVKDYGAVGDGYADDTNAISAALHAVGPAGGIVYFPPGTYKITSTLTLDNSGSAAGRFTRRVWFMGAGAAASAIYAPGLAAPAIKYVGGTGSNEESYIGFEKLRITSFLPPSGTIATNSTGVYIQDIAFAAFRDFVVEGFDYNLDGYDFEESSFDNVNLRYGNQGLRLQRKTGGGTYPNQITFSNVNIGSNQNYGAYIIGGTNVAFIGSSFQYNGNAPTVASPGQWGLRLDDFSFDGGAASVRDVYFEGNAGTADLWINHTGNAEIGSGIVAKASVDIASNTFNRVNTGTTFATNNILISSKSNANIPINVRISANGHKYYGSYTPSASRAVIAVTNPGAAIYDDGTNFYQSAIEAPAWPLSQMAARHKLTGATTLYIAPSGAGGSDSNNGLTASTPFLTVQHAVDTVAQLFDLNGQNVTLRIADGTYPGPTTLRPTVGWGLVTLLGDTRTPANVVLSASGGDNAMTGIQLGASGYLLAYMALTTLGSGHCLQASYGGVIQVSNVTFGPCGGAAMYASNGSGIQATGTLVAAGSAAYLWLARIAGWVQTANQTITFSGSPAFSQSVAYADAVGYLGINNMTFTNGGTVTGQRWVAHNNGVIQANSTCNTYIPGNANGSAVNGGQCN